MQKSRPWAAMVAVVVLAALVVLSGCQGAIGKSGPAGPAGPAGTTGTTGTPGTPDNAGPTASGTIPTQYLVVDGLKTRPATPATPTAAAAAGNYGSVDIDLNAYFTDTKTPALSFTVVSADKTIASLNTSATTNLITGGGSTLTVTAKGVGTVATETSATVTITVKAFDGVNDPVEASFDVVVVKSNRPPSVTGVDPIDDLVDKVAVTTPATPAVNNKLYKAAGTITREFKATIGTEKEKFSFRAIVGNGKAADAVVSVTKPVSAGTNTYSVSIKALKPSVSDDPVNMPADGLPNPDATPMMVKIFAMDSFGAESLVTKFYVVVNRPPVVGLDLTNVVLFRGSNTAAAEARGWVPSVSWPGVMYTLDEYFDDLDLSGIVPAADTTAGNVDYIGDTTCTFSTSPKQPTGRTGTTAVPATADEAAVLEIKADPATATTLATVNNGAAAATKDQTTLVDSKGVGPTGEVDNDAEVMVSAAPAGALGPLTLTITCEDPDATVSSSARITVRSGTGT